MLLFLIMLLNLSPAKKAIMLSPLHTPVKVITFPLILDCDNVFVLVVGKYTYVKNTFGKYVKCVNLRDILLAANQSKSTLEYIGEYTLHRHMYSKLHLQLAKRRRGWFGQNMRNCVCSKLA